MSREQTKQLENRINSFLQRKQHEVFGLAEKSRPNMKVRVHGDSAYISLK